MRCTCPWFFEQSSDDSDQAPTLYMHPPCQPFARMNLSILYIKILGFTIKKKEAYNELNMRKMNFCKPGLHFRIFFTQCVSTLHTYQPHSKGSQRITVAFKFEFWEQTLHIIHVCCWKFTWWTKGRCSRTDWLWSAKPLSKMTAAEMWDWWICAPLTAVVRPVHTCATATSPQQSWKSVDSHLCVGLFTCPSLRCLQSTETNISRAESL